MKNTKQLVIAIAAGVLMVVGAKAQGNFGEIKGIITEEETKETMPGVNVWVEVNGEKQGTSTDIDGKFTIKPLKPGTYILHASFINKVELKQEVVVYPDQISYLNSLVLSDTTLPEFEFKAYVDPIIDPEQTSKKTVRYEDIKHNPNLRDIKKLAGTLSTEIKVSESGDAYVRGGRSDASIYFVDGVKVQGQSFNVPGVAIGSLTVYTGGVPAKYGDVTGGVIIVETKSYMDLYNAAQGR
ncbi:MAG: carboxypeptidase-like regulatory domain-containing protein [Bacteroidota bacterium]